MQQIIAKSPGGPFETVLACQHNVPVWAWLRTLTRYWPVNRQFAIYAVMQDRSAGSLDCWQQTALTAVEAELLRSVLFVQAPSG